jgi:NAD(P)-dependent dehydrogenase (short-subunit alcohol dehydrogenase family)
LHHLAIVEMIESPKVVLITGAAKRIGAAIARELAAQGWAIAIHCHHSQHEAQALAQELSGKGTNAHVFVADLQDETSVMSLMPAVAKHFGGVQALVNNASAFEYDEAQTFSATRAQQLYATNAIAPVLLARELFSHLAKDTQGCVVNLLDQKLWNPNPDYLSYTLSKAALQAATVALAQALAPRVRVCGVAPGVTLPSSDATLSGGAFGQAHGMTPLNRSSEPEDIAQAVRYLLEARAVTGHTLLVDGGQHLQAQARDLAFLQK